MADALRTVLYGLGGWGLLSLLACLVVTPFLRVARQPPGERDLGVPSPQRLGYTNVVLDRIARHARGVLGVERSCIFMCSRDGSRTTITAVAAAGLDEDLVGRRVPAGGGPAAHAIRSGRPVVAPAQGQVVAAAPIPGRHGVWGAFWVAGEHEQLGAREVELLSELAALAAAAIAHHERRELAASDSKAEIEALVGALARADGGTWRHSLAVACVAAEVGRRLGLDEADLVEVRLGALLHDVGKLRVPRAILRKRGPLTAEEWDLMRLHPEWGAEMVARIPGLEAVSLLVRLHHERADGSGYPHELPCKRIPIASRIIAACDAYGAMTDERPYRDPLEPSVAVEELRRHDGSQFDPGVTDALAEVVCPDQLVAA